MGNTLNGDINNENIVNNKTDREKLIKKFEEYILDEHDGSLDKKLNLLELSREEIFMNFFHIVRDNPEDREEFKIMMEEIIGGKPSSIIGDDFYNEVENLEKLDNEMIYLLAAEELLYG